jgi:hypothetical protein
MALDVSETESPTIATSLESRTVTITVKMTVPPGPERRAGLALNVMVDFEFDARTGAAAADGPRAPSAPTVSTRAVAAAAAIRPRTISNVPVRLTAAQDQGRLRNTSMPTTSVIQPKETIHGTGSSM